MATIAEQCSFSTQASARARTTTAKAVSRRDKDRSAVALTADTPMDDATVCSGGFDLFKNGYAAVPFSDVVAWFRRHLANFTPVLARLDGLNAVS